MARFSVDKFLGVNSLALSKIIGGIGDGAEAWGKVEQGTVTTRIAEANFDLLCTIAREGKSVGLIEKSSDAEALMRKLGHFKWDKDDDDKDSVTA